MDNVNFVKLPSEVLPTVTGKNVVIAETASGKLYWLDSSGAKRLLDSASAFPPGTIIERADNISPATYLGGTWEKIAEGRVIVGAGTTYPLNSTGGEATHALTVMEMPSHNHDLRYELNAVGFGGGYPTMGTSVTDPKSSKLSIEAVGGSLPHNNIQPYIAKNIWERIA